MSVEFDILPLSKYDPEKDFIIANVYVGKMRPDRAKRYLDRTRDTLKAYFDELGFKLIVLPITYEMAQLGFKSHINVELNDHPTPTEEDLEYFRMKMTRGLGDKKAEKQYFAAKAAQDAYDPTSRVEDFVFPNPSDGKGSKVETLEGVVQHADPVNRNPCHPYALTPKDPFEDAKKAIE